LAEDDNDNTASLTVTLIFDSKTGSIEVTVEVYLDWDSFEMDLVGQCRLPLSNSR